eukprot:scaffold58037_cov28-Tisochrysis_lutea.AAC.3
MSSHAPASSPTLLGPTLVRTTHSLPVIIARTTQRVGPCMMLAHSLHTPFFPCPFPARRARGCPPRLVRPGLT